MLKGINRNVIVVRTDAKSRFEAVYFVLKKGGAGERADIVREANKIISESGVQRAAPMRALRAALIAVLSALIGAAVALSVCLWVFL